jgi:hypothetical protein
MKVNELRPGLLVQYNTTGGTASQLLQVSSVHPNCVTTQVLINRFRFGDSEILSRTGVVTYSAEEVKTRLHPASAQLVNSFTEALHAARVVG